MYPKKSDNSINQHSVNAILWQKQVAEYKALVHQSINIVKVQLKSYLVNPSQIDIHKYLRLLEEMVILTLKEYGLEGTRSPGETGVWLDVGTPFARKICALGVKASRWVTMHGFALNVNTDLTYFDYIIPCGIQGKGVTSLQAELKRAIPLDEVRGKLSTHFQALFEAEFIAVN